ncbi:MAG: phosphoribosylformimino-5-aminoimidazole carboxamide ribotide isomerase [Lachnospiraceae bacterium]|jgi:phosphoribosylformimino-5-aminoimidazole carboxamide ribotide isomerase, eukaryotic type|nr:phosphoribosylformimino-5-aminoimidazole carboxamide ribotide isomerase [Lachnospiraceae bacterium]
MKFRPCIDIHNGQVKQIVGGSLKDENNDAVENFVSVQDAAYYAELYKRNHISGGHVILLNPMASPYYEVTKQQALLALDRYKGGLQAGGGITDKNAAEYLNAGASHVIVTSFVFQNGEINYDNLNKLIKAVGKQRLVLDVSCRKKNGKYFIVTDRWQKFTNVILTEQIFDKLSRFCDEFLIHAVDAEGKAKGIEEELAEIMGKMEGITMTYAGGISCMEDLWTLKKLGKGKIDFTIGSALDIFGGKMNFEEAAAFQ